MKTTPLIHSVESTAEAVREITNAYKRLKSFTAEIALAEKHPVARFDLLQTAASTSEMHRRALVGAMEELCDRYGTQTNASIINARRILGEVQKWVV